MFLLILVVIPAPCHYTQPVSYALLHSLSEGPSARRFPQKHLNNTLRICPESPYLRSEPSLAYDSSQAHSLSGYGHRSVSQMLSFGFRELVLIVLKSCIPW